MDYSVGCGPPQVPEPKHGKFTQFHQPNSIRHHHHHQFRVSPHCPLHSFMLHPKSHSPTCPFLASSYPQSRNPETLASVPSPINPFDLQVSQPKETIFNGSLAMHEETNVEMEEEGEHQEGEGEGEGEEEDPVFVLTDEWREFFAKSEAKRKLAKKQARRKGKNRMEQ